MKFKSRITKMDLFARISKIILSCGLGNILFKYVLVWSNGSVTVVNPVFRRFSAREVRRKLRAGMK